MHKYDWAALVSWLLAILVGYIAVFTTSIGVTMVSVLGAIAVSSSVATVVFGVVSAIKTTWKGVASLFITGGTLTLIMYFGLALLILAFNSN